jgi:hypothetical protein
MFAALVGLGILTMALFPFALPGLLLFVVAPLALVAVVGLLLAIPLVLPLGLARIVMRSRSAAAAQPGGRSPTVVPRKLHLGGGGNVRRPTMHN